MSRQTLKTWYSQWCTTAVPAAWETEAGGAWVWGQPGLHKVLSPKSKQMNEHRNLSFEKAWWSWTTEGLASEPVTSSSSSPVSTYIFIPDFYMKVFIQNLKAWRMGETMHREDGAQHFCNQWCKPVAKVSLPSWWTGQEPSVVGFWVSSLISSYGLF